MTNQTNQTNQQVTITAYNLVDTLVQVQEYVKQGYTFDLVSVANAPQTLGSLFIVPMVKAETLTDDQQAAIAGSLKANAAVNTPVKPSVTKDGVQEGEIKGATEVTAPVQTKGRKKAQ